MGTRDHKIFKNSEDGWQTIVDFTASKRLKRIAIDKQDNLWYSYACNLSKYNGDTTVSVRIGDNQSGVGRFIVDSEGLVWMIKIASKYMRPHLTSVVNDTEKSYYNIKNKTSFIIYTHFLF